MRPGENHQFSLKINHLILNYVHVTEIDTIQILLKDYSNFGEDLFFEIPINRTVPCEIPGSLKLPAKIASWYAMIIVNGTVQYGYPQQLPFLWASPIISTGYHPIYDARLGRSNWTIDEPKIVKIKCMLNSYGFDCSTIGKEIQTTVPKGKNFMDFEKEWASGGHCFISVLTPRDRTADGRLALPSPWVITESGLSFRSDRPHLVFIENEVDRVALYGEMDAAHMMGFQAVNNKVLF